ncbi:MAG: RHS repeat-associated core domain-containing protein [Ktedonobacteraceae bacterium]|nr:RHS repeat-associated core domain-containing protein [Ktedonobacteraceae bacterium]
MAGTATYDAYGRVLTQTGTLTPFGYAGEYTDAASGLQYLRARSYDPATQQFLTVDPLLAQTAQAYAYAGGSPTNATDPSGESTRSICLPAGWAVAVKAIPFFGERSDGGIVARNPSWAMCASVDNHGGVAVQFSDGVEKAGLSAGLGVGVGVVTNDEDAVTVKDLDGSYQQLGGVLPWKTLGIGGDIIHSSGHNFTSLSCQTGLGVDPDHYMEGTTSPLLEFNIPDMFNTFIKNWTDHANADTPLNSEYRKMIGIDPINP